MSNANGQDVQSLPPVLTVEEAASLLRISRGSAYEAVRSNEIPHVRIGRTIRVPRAALLGLLGEVDPADTALEAEQHEGVSPAFERSCQRRRVEDGEGE